MREDSRELATEIMNHILSLASLITKHYQANLNKNRHSHCELTNSQYQILIAVKYWNCSTLSDLEKTLNLTSSSLSTVVSRLVNSGYLVKEHPGLLEDGRKVYLSVTEKAAKEMTELYDSIAALLKESYEGLADYQKENACKGIDKLMLVFQNKVNNS